MSQQLVTSVIVLTVLGGIETSFAGLRTTPAGRGPCLVAASWMVARGELTCLNGCLDSEAGLDLAHR